MKPANAPQIGMTTRSAKYPEKQKTRPTIKAKIPTKISSKTYLRRRENTLHRPR